MWSEYHCVYVPNAKLCSPKCSILEPKSSDTIALTPDLEPIPSWLDNRRVRDCRIPQSADKTVARKTKLSHLQTRSSGIPILETLLTITTLGGLGSGANTEPFS